MRLLPTQVIMVCCVFRLANARFCMVKNDEKHWKMMKKVTFPSCAQEAHVRRMKKNEEKSLLVCNSEWLSKAGCSFGILLFFVAIYCLWLIPYTYLRRLHRSKKNHQKIIVIGQIIGSGNIDSFRSIESIIKWIQYPNF